MKGNVMRFLRSIALALGLSTSVATGALADTPAGTVVMARQMDDLIGFDPAEVFETSGSEAVANIYDRLIAFDLADSSKLYGALAESWTISADSKTYTIKLKPGIKFHSGNPMTSEDVAYSLQRAVSLNKTPGFILTQFGLNAENVKDMIKVVDDLSVSITVEKPYAPTLVLNALTTPVASVVDSKVVREHEENGDFGNAWLKLNSAGSGAFKLRAWRANEQYTLDANSDWYAGAPAIKRLVMRHVSEPASQRLLLEKGDIDYARNLSKDQLEALKSNSDIVQQSGNKGNILYLGLNQKNENLAKPEVREALKWLVDYDGIEKNILAGTWRKHESFLPSGFLGAIDDEPYKFDVAKAKELLAKAGLTDGFSVTMDVRSITPITEIAQAIQANWAQAGIKLELIPGDGKQTLTKYRARAHDIYIGQWGPDYQDPHSNAYTFAMNENNADDAKSKTLAWRNSWDIPELTKTTQALVFETDAEKRKKGYEDLQREHQANSPFVMLFQQVETAAHRKNVDGLIIGPGADTNFFSKLVKE